MASIFKLLFLIIFLALVFEGDAGCSPFEPQGVDIVQTKTGNIINGRQEWKVTITNDCRCSQSQVKLYCKGFKTNEAVDPSILKISGSLCLLNNGRTIHPSESVEFLYASASKYPFILAYSIVNCSS
ncbi:uncharacterized protein LOC109810878 [Cajanus cajan]|uniref:Uncharacterized protein n=1 Tax=Cajanus cajan TaxID=3821 RepID=A0A151UAX3_CAJCA|nr:uncharacterized protein LOC109810878 [Cajanus cajan]KYP76467.1 hypothetical protein KK1_020711 [Cajanus cajan]